MTEDIEKATPGDLQETMDNLEPPADVSDVQEGNTNFFWPAVGSKRSAEQMELAPTNHDEVPKVEAPKEEPPKVEPEAQEPDADVKSEDAAALKSAPVAPTGDEASALQQVQLLLQSQLQQQGANASDPSQPGDNQNQVASNFQQLSPEQQVAQAQILQNYANYVAQMQLLQAMVYMQSLQSNSENGGTTLPDGTTISPTDLTNMSAPPPGLMSLTGTEGFGTDKHDAPEPPRSSGGVFGEPQQMRPGQRYFGWRKYGEKRLKKLGNGFKGPSPNLKGGVTRAYFKCTFPQCRAKKYVVSYTEVEANGNTVTKQVEEMVSQHDHN